MQTTRTMSISVIGISSILPTTATRSTRPWGTTRGTGRGSRSGLDQTGTMIRGTTIHTTRPVGGIPTMGMAHTAMGTGMAMGTVTTTPTVIIPDTASGGIRMVQRGPSVIHGRSGERVLQR